MEIIFNAVGSFIVEVGKNVCKCIYPKIENVVRFSSKIENIREEIEKLRKLRDDIKGKVEVAEREGYKPKPDVIQWIDNVRKLENEWETMQGSIAEAKKLAYKCCPNCSLRWEVSTQGAWNIRDELCRLKEVEENFGSNLLVENYQMKKVEFIPGPSIQGQSAATRNLNKILQLLEDDKGCIIGVLGTGGVGKTTLVKNLNNELLKIDVSRSKLSFGVVVWVTVPKPPIDIRNVQAQIANRLNLNVDNEGSVQSSACRIYERLKQEESFLLILDDVWKDVDLELIGVPRPETTARSKVIITSRSLEVCRKMKTSEETEMMVRKLDEDESWKLFVENAGDVANLEDIQPLAKEITRECDGLPLAITVIGASMRGKKRVELWKDALNSLRMSEPHNEDVKDKVYKVIKYSFDSLVSQDIELSSEQRNKHVNKKRGDIQSCFLYCSLYPAAISTDDLIHCWWAEGFLSERNTYEEAYNRGITMIESLKNACLLEAHMMHCVKMHGVDFMKKRGVDFMKKHSVDFVKMYPVDYVKMHDVVRDVAKWIANTFGDEHTSVFQVGIGLAEISASVKRISFVSNQMECLPDCFTKCPETTSLLLQENPFQKIPHGLFLAFPALRVLNLSETSITALPSSINSLYQLRALILKNCMQLTELPPIGDLCNLQVLDCYDTRLHCLLQGMDKLINLRLLNMLGSCHLLGPTSFDEISCLHNLTCLFITLDSSSISNRDHTWMSRLKRFHIEIGECLMLVPFNKSARMIGITESEIFSNGELSVMLQFASDLCLEECRRLRNLIAYNSFDELKSLHIERCFCDFRHLEEGSGQFDPLPNLEHLSLNFVYNLKCVSDFSQHLGLRFSKLRHLNISSCLNLTCLFNVGEVFSVPKHLEVISIRCCEQLVELFVQCSSSDQATLVNSEIPRVRKLELRGLPELGMLGEPQSMWEHLEELMVMHCHGIRKLPLSIQTSDNIKLIKGEPEWWRQLEWDDHNFKSNLEHCFKESYWW